MSYVLLQRHKQVESRKSRAEVVPVKPEEFDETVKNDNIIHLNHDILIIYLERNAFK